MQNLFDKFLEESKIRYEDLNEQEKETYKRSFFNSKTLTLSDLTEHITYMKDAVAIQLADTPDTVEDFDKNRKLKARLKNYALLEAFLKAPEKAEKAFKLAQDQVDKKPVV